MPSIFQRVFRRAVIDLCRIGDISIGILHLEIVRCDLASVDRPLAVDNIIDDIVARCGRPELILERVSHIRILDIMCCPVARIHICRKGGCATPIGARCRGGRGGHHSLIPRRETRCRDIVHTENICEYRAGGIVGKARDRCRVVPRCTVVGLRHIAHRDVQLARRDRPRICHRAEIRRDGLRCTRAGGRRTDDSIALIDNLIIVRILTRELRRIGDRLLDDIATAVAGDLPICIECRRGVVACLSAHPPREGDDRVALDLSAISIRMLPHPVVDLRDLFRRRPNRGRGNRPRCRHRVARICALDILKIAPLILRRICLAKIVV